MCDPLEGAEFPLQQPYCQHPHSTPVRAHFLCQDCTAEKRYLCHTCHGHHSKTRPTTEHRVLGLEEYNRDPTKYILAKDDTCEKHAEVLEFVCDFCHDFLCDQCLKGKDVVCSRAPSGTTRHVPVFLDHGVEPLKANIRDSKMAADSLIAEASTSLIEIGDKKKEACTLMTRTVDCIDQKIESLKAFRMKTEDNMKAKIQEMSDLESDLEVFLQNKANEKVLADNTLACPAPLEVHRAEPELRARLEAAPPELLPSVFPSQLLTAGLEQLDDVLVSLGPLAENPFATAAEEPLPKPHRVVQRKLQHPPGPDSYVEDMIKTRDQTIEAAGFDGLWATGGRSRVKVVDPDQHGGAAVEASSGSTTAPRCHRGVCASRDGQVFYSTVRKNGGHYIEKYKLGEDGSWEMEKHSKIEGAGIVRGISLNRKGQLAVADEGHSPETSRITLHSCDTLTRLSVVACVSQGVQIMSNPRYAAWDPSGDRLYVTSRSGMFLSEESVVCLRLSRPPVVVWKKKVLNSPWNIRYIRGLVYVTHEKENRVTVLSAADGTVVETIDCPGEARGVEDDIMGRLVITSYSDKEPAE